LSADVSAAMSAVDRASPRASALQCFFSRIVKSPFRINSYLVFKALTALLA
jgi:hypothetical protein